MSKQSIRSHFRHLPARLAFGALVGTVAAVVAVLLVGASARAVPLAALIRPTNQGRITPATIELLNQAKAKLTSAAGIAQLLNSDRVVVKVGSARISSEELASRTSGYEAEFLLNAVNNAGRAGLSPKAALAEVDAQPVMPTAVQTAVAYDALRQMLFQAAQAAGTAASMSDAESYATQQYQTSLALNANGGSQGGSTVPKEDGVPYPLPASVLDPNSYFSTTALQTYQLVITDAAQINSIAGPIKIGSDQQEVSRTPALAAWMNQNLSTYPVSVSGVAGVSPSNVASFLPTNL